MLGMVEAIGAGGAGSAGSAAVVARLLAGWLACLPSEQGTIKYTYIVV